MVFIWAKELPNGAVRIYILDDKSVPMCLCVNWIFLIFFPTGEITIIVGLIIAIIGYICYRQCLKRIDLYIKNLQDENDDQRVMRKHNDHDYDEIPASRSSEEKKQFLDWQILLE